MLAQGQLGVIPIKIFFEVTLRVGLVKPHGNLLLPYFQAFWANLGVGPGGGSKVRGLCNMKSSSSLYGFFGVQCVSFYD